MFCMLTSCPSTRLYTDGTRVEDRSIRYVAEENIEIIKPDTSELPPIFSAIAGKHFKRWDEHSRTYVSNIRDEYPDD